MKSSAFVKKYSVVFISRSGKASEPFYFFNRYDRDSIAQTWQVLRSEFDQMLLDNARERGAEVREEITVKELLREGNRVVGVRAQEKDGKFALDIEGIQTRVDVGEFIFIIPRSFWFIIP